MGRPKKKEEEKKIKVGICMDRSLYKKIMSDGGKTSQVIEGIIKEYVRNKGL